MDVYSLKQHLKNNTELLELILEQSGFHDISDNFSGGDEYRCAWESGGNPTKVRVDKHTLNSTVFGSNTNGDIFTLLQSKLNMNFPKTVDFVAKVINFEEVDVKDYQLPFGGFYKKIQRFKDNEVELTTYDESILDNFVQIPNVMFYQDGINEDTQTRFKIGYDTVTQRITIVWRDTSGKIVGIMGRKNVRDVEEGDNKYLPIIQFPKSKVIYGFSENYTSIQENKLAFIGESEKFTLALDSFGTPLGLSLGGSTMSESQANNIKSLFCNKLIIGLDEGLAIDISVEMAKKLKMKRYFKNEVFYIHDKSNLYLPKGSKMSPTDLPKEDFKRLLKHCLIKYEE